MALDRLPRPDPAKAPAAARPAAPAGAPPDTEFELRLALPPGLEAALRRAFRLPAVPARRQRLRAIYFDTPGRDLARAGLGLRLRREGGRWVQTVKDGAPHALARGEHNVALAGLAATPVPRPDPARHAGTGVGEALQACLAQVQAVQGEDAARLVEGFRTDVWRERHGLRRRGGQVELALDRGRLEAPDGQGGWRRWPVEEVELESTGGSPRAVLEAGARAVALGLRLELRSKAERGWRLVADLGPSRPGPARPAWPGRFRLAEAEPAAQHRALRLALAGPVLRNAGELAGGQGSGEALHQLRVGLRRLRAADALFKGAPGVVPPASAAGLKALFRALGPAREADALAQGLGPRLARAEAAAGLGPRAAAGASALDPVEAACTVLRQAAAQQALLQLVGEVALPAEAVPGALAATPGRPWTAGQRLRRWHHRLRAAARDFDRLDDEARHALRKGLKRLRYGLDACAAALPGKALKAQLRALGEAQEALGAFQDLCTAEAAQRAAAAAGEPRAAFALGWLAREREAVLAEASRALRRWRAVELPAGRAAPRE